MSQSRATKFIRRSPRYTLQPEDNKYIRFAHQNESGQSHTTHFIDISMTGLAFVTDRENAPQIFDLIKLEIPLNNNQHDNQTIAWWARVARIEEYSPHKWYLNRKDFPTSNQVLVGVTFHELPAGHVKLIRKTLEEKFEDLHKTHKIQRLQDLSIFVASQFWRLLIYGACIAFTVWLLYTLSRPSPNYDPDKGAPWGQRFPQLNFFTPSQPDKIDND